MMDEQDKDILARIAVGVMASVLAVLTFAATAGMAVSVFRLFGGF